MSNRAQIFFAIICYTSASRGLIKVNDTGMWAHIKFKLPHSHEGSIGIFYFWGWKISRSSVPSFQL